MTIETPDIPRDRPLMIVGGVSSSESDIYDMAPFTLRVIPGFPSNPFDSMFRAYWELSGLSFDGAPSQGEAKTLGLPKLETRRNGDKLEVWAVNWE